jgi:two-component system, OmpR family, sensor histidine kinase KdpD
MKELGIEKREEKFRGTPVQIATAIMILVIATLLSMFFRHLNFSAINIAVVYILSVLIVSRFTRGYIYGIAASLVNIFCFNYFFTQPYYTFHVYNRDYLTTFIVMLVASILTSTLTSKILESSAAARRSEKQTKMLYQITSSLAMTSSVSEVATVSVQWLANLLDCEVHFITFDAGGKLSEEYSVEKGQHRVNVRSLTSDVTEQVLNDKFILPISGQTHQYGIICLPQKCVRKEGDQAKLLSSIATQICVAMGRERLANEKEAVKAEAEREKFKSNLLRAISHDLRTPLTGIMGSSELLLYSLKNEDNRKLVQGIYDDSNWLTQMVENILSLTKIEEGKLIAHMQEEAAEEIVAEAVNRSSKYVDNRKITAELPDEVLFIPMDGKLIMQVLINLIDNAVKHTSRTDEIKVKVKVEENKAWFSVIDNGTGISPDDLPKIFNLFYTVNGSHADSQRGIGLGLAICKAIVNAHGGQIYADNNEGGGANIRFYLPMMENVSPDGE